MSKILRKIRNLLPLIINAVLLSYFFEEKIVTLILAKISFSSLQGLPLLVHFSCKTIF